MRNGKTFLKDWSILYFFLFFFTLWSPSVTMLCENNRQTRIHSETHSQVAGSTAELIRNIIIMVMFISVGVLKCVIILRFAVARLYFGSFVFV